MTALTEVNDKLDDLEAGDPLLPRDANPTGALEVVPVHDNVHQEVNVDDDPLHRSQADELGVAQKGRRAMVVGVKEGQRLLFEEQEGGVDQFNVFGQVVELSGQPAHRHIAVSWIDLHSREQ